jgi:topoisomerase IV subunit B
VRDYGRGMPLGKVIDCVSKINTGAKYDSNAFKKSVGLNGVGSKAVNAHVELVQAQSIGARRQDQDCGIQNKVNSCTIIHVVPDEGRQGTMISFVPDEEIFGKYRYIHEYVEEMLWNYVFLNNGLTIVFNGHKFQAKNGLLDLLERNMAGTETRLYPIIHIRDDDFECAFTHSNNTYNEEYYSFVNGQHTTQGGTHQAAFVRPLKTIREFYNKDYDTADIRNSLVAAISIKVQEPVFESQTKTKLGSQYIESGGQSHP